MRRRKEESKRKVGISLTIDKENYERLSAHTNKNSFASKSELVNEMTESVLGLNEEEKKKLITFVANRISAISENEGTIEQLNALNRLNAFLIKSSN